MSGNNGWILGWQVVFVSYQLLVLGHGKVFLITRLQGLKGVCITEYRVALCLTSRFLYSSEKALTWRTDSPPLVPHLLPPGLLSSLPLTEKATQLLETRHSGHFLADSTSLSFYPICVLCWYGFFPPYQYSNAELYCFLTSSVLVWRGSNGKGRGREGGKERKIGITSSGWQ